MLTGIQRQIGPWGVLLRHLALVCQLFFACFGLSVVLRYYTNAFAMSGPWGEPTAKTSTCFYKFPSKWKRWFFVETSNSSVRLVLVMLRSYCLIRTPNNPYCRELSALFHLKSNEIAVSILSFLNHLEIKP